METNKQSLEAVPENKQEGEREREREKKREKTKSFSLASFVCVSFVRRYLNWQIHVYF